MKGDPLSSEYAKPLPYITEDSRPFWEAAKDHRLVLPLCGDCGKYHYYPRLVCPHCGSRDISFAPVSGRGAVYAFSIQYRAQGPGWTGETPYVTALIDLEEGPRMLSNLIEVEPDPGTVRCGMHVEVVFDDVTPEITLPKFKPVEA